MSDIVDRLRDDQPGERQCVREARMDLGGLLMEAADEIEKLRAALTEVMVWINEWEPAFIQDGEWRETKRMVRAALGEKQ
jgi:hypothetical protein